MARDLSRLKSQLMVSGLQDRDNPLYQVINQLIGIVEGINRDVATGSGGGGGGSVTNITNHNYQILNGSDDSGEDGNVMLIQQGSSTPPSSSVDHVVMSDGGIPTAQPLNDGAGQFIYTVYTP